MSARIWVWVAAGVFSISWCAHGDEPAREKGNGGVAPNWVAAAERLPKLAAREGAIELPLSNEEPFIWRGIAEGIEVSSAEVAGGAKGSREIVVKYRSAPQSAAGVAFLIPKGALAEIETLRIDFACDAARTLLVSVRDARGLAFSFPMVATRGGEGARSYEFERAGLTFDEGQSAGLEAAGFDPSLAAMLTIVDISTYMRPETRDVSWRITRARFELGAAAKGAKATKGGRATDGKAKDGDAKGAAATSGSDAEALFFKALNRDASLAERAQRSLLAEYLREPKRARTALLLGLSHLWSAAEPKPGDPAAYDHLLLAESYLERAGHLDPAEDRLASWLVPLRVSRAALEGRGAEVATLLEPLREANREDLCFHSFALGLMCRALPSDDPLFQESLASLREAAACKSEDPGAQNLPRWPHNREGFLLLLAEFEWRAGNADRAAQALAAVEHVSEFPAWRFDGEREELRARMAADPKAERAERIARGTLTEPPSWVPGATCQVCHMGP